MKNVLVIVISATVLASMTCLANDIQERCELLKKKTEMLASIVHDFEKVSLGKRYQMRGCYMLPQIPEYDTLMFEHAHHYCMNMDNVGEGIISENVTKKSVIQELESRLLDAENHLQGIKEQNNLDEFCR